jgi:hypothetical protein
MCAGLKRLAEAEQAMTDGEYSAARTALGAARSMLEIAKDFEGLERVRELQGRVEAAEASRSSGEAMVEAENALQRADFAAAKAAVAAARSTMLKANQGCEEVDALQRRIDVAERASEALAEAEKLLEEARHRAEVERKFDEAKERIILARAAAEKFVAEQTALMSQEPVTDERVPAADSGLAALLVPDWKEKWDSRVGELAAFLAWLQDMQQKQARAAELLERAQNAFHEDELEQALKLVNEVSQIASTLAESKAEDVKEQGIRIAADAEYLAARIKSAIDGKSAVEEARRALQTGIDLLKEDKLGEATEQAGKVRAALPRITDQEELGQSLNEQTELLEKAINRAYAAEEADAATSEVRERIGELICILYVCIDTYIYTNKRTYIHTYIHAAPSSAPSSEQHGGAAQLNLPPELLRAAPSFELPGYMYMNIYIYVYIYIYIYIYMYIHITS